ncbi:MAG: glycosyltransferase [Bacilli bacterium]|nr:glycosyltransferase [Bacilli bacterium]
MRIGLFADTYPPQINGVSTSVQMLKQALEREGHIVYVITSNNESAFKYKYDEKERVLRVPGIKTGLYDYRLSRIYPVHLRKFIKSWKLEVIHSHHEFSIGIMARLLAKELNIPLVHTLHTMYEDNLEIMTKGHFEKTSKKILEEFTNLFCDKTCNELIVPTVKVYTLLKDKYGFTRNIHVIPSGIEIERFYQENLDKKVIEQIKKENGIKKSDRVLIYLGRIGPEKSIDFLIKAMPKLIKKDKNIKLLIVGPGPEEDNLKKLAKDLDLEKDVIFTGGVHWEDVPYYYACGEILVTASTYETQGLTMVEGMATSLAPVCINDPALTSCVTDKIDGLVFNDEEEYIDEIMALIKDKKLLEEIQTNARRRAEDYSSKAYASKVIEVYKEAMESKKKKDNKNIVNRIVNKIKGGSNDSSVEQ